MTRRLTEARQTNRETGRSMVSTLKKLWTLLEKRQRMVVAVLLGIAIVSGLIQVLGVSSIMPFIAVLTNQDMIEQNRWLHWAYVTFGFQSDHAFLIALGILTFAATVVANAFMAATQWLLVRFAWNHQYRLSRRLLEKYLLQNYVAFLGRNSAETGKNVLQEVSLLTTGLVLPALRMIAAVVTAVAIVGFLLFVNPLLTLVVVAVLGGGYALLFAGVRKALARAGQKRIRANTARFKAVNEAFGGIKEAKVLGKEPDLLRQFDSPARRFASAQATSGIISQVPTYALQILSFGIVLLLVLYYMVVYRDVTSVIPLVTLYAFAGYRLMPALQKVYSGLSQLRFNAVIADTIYDDMVSKPGVVALPERLEEPARIPLSSEIRLERASFTYPSATSSALADIDISIPRGSSVALVGATGAGKTTLADVVLGLLPPTEGRLLVDGVEIDESNRRAWQNNLGYVPQEIYLSDETIARNIAFGVPDREVDLQAVERAARIANLHSFVVDELTKGYQTVVGERGVRLSGGQRQRIGIARALYHDPDVLVLDEATSALDGVTESAVFDAINGVAGTKTLIIIAHRLTTIKECDAVFRLAHGRVVATGTYATLMESDQHFRQMAGVRS